VNLATPFGRVEYAQAGEGPPLLFVHGVFGGYDFGRHPGRNRRTGPSGRNVSWKRQSHPGAPDR
ncbi:MAG: hypothetical protein ACXVHQ_39885, partial [Solirubrobacteraceae bacterium]